MGMAAAQNARHSSSDFRLSRFGIPVQECLSRQNDPVNTEAALHGLLIDKGLLNCMRLFNRPKPFECGDLCPYDSAHACDTGPYRLSFDTNGARPTLAETTPKLRPAQPQIVTEYVKQRSFRIDVHRLGPAIDSQSQNAHVTFSSGLL